MNHAGCINTVAVHRTPYEVCTGIPSLKCSQIQEMLSYTVLQYNSEISTLVGGGIEGKSGKKRIALFLTHLFLMQWGTAPGQSSRKTHRSCLTISLLLTLPWGSGRTGSCLTHTWTKKQIWLEGLKSIWDTMAKCPFPAHSRVAKWTLPTRLHFLSSWANTPLAITEEHKNNNWGLYGLWLISILALEPKDLSAYSERDKIDISLKLSKLAWLAR